MVILSKKPFGAHQYLDWDVLEEYGLVQPIKQLLSSGPWETLFQIQEPAYQDITLAFLATMEIHKKRVEDGWDNYFSFEVYGRKHILTISQFCVFMGLYTEDFTHTEEFRDLNCRWPAQADSPTCWKQLTGNSDLDYFPSSFKTSLIKDDHLKVCHWLLTNTI